ncbi:MAG: SMP-30/gluconolactonase/LRE family protein [Verrucomicrobia bacterium]|jgi:gluconolactonase|nr:SMP-30/gluconolactonase/LRE family protein [Verrucomicrobiota bacterium]
MIAMRFLIPLALMLVTACRTPSPGLVSPFTSQTKMLLGEHAGEGPAWHPDWGLLFSGEGDITRFTSSGDSEVFRPNAGSNGLLFDKNERLLICENIQRRITRLEADGTLTVLTDHYQGKQYNQPNDITVDSRGRIYFTDPRYGSREDMQIKGADGKAVEGVYRIDLDGSVPRVITHEVDRPNGILVTPDDRFVYIADNNNNEIGGERKLWRFELAADGSIRTSTQELIYDWKTGRGPDGMAIDRDGRLYVAGGRTAPKLPAETAAPFLGGIYVFSPMGQLIEFLPIPHDEVTNCSFGGPDFKDLFVTAGGTLWTVRTRTAGALAWNR